ncbi:OLC1v1013407C2 [Oldenlandia corymbosa var. corymbosa]|nr:OLC1v1013407C2 [Oldenlandia corymbosa var. corymbosa]
MELQFYKIFFWRMCFPEELFAPDWMLHFTLMTQKFRRAAEEFKMQNEAASAEDQITNWDLMSYRLKTVMQEHMPETREMCRMLLHGGFKRKLYCQLEISTREYVLETFDFMNLIDINLGALDVISLQFDPIVAQQIAVIQQRMFQFTKILHVFRTWPFKSMGTVEIIYHFHSWVCNISHLVFLYRADHRMNESLATAKGIQLFFAIWEMFPKLLPDYVDFLLELVVKNYSKDHIEVNPETIREGLMLLLSFVMDSPHEILMATELILSETNAIISELPSIICIPHTDKLCNLLCKIDRVKVKLRELYVVTPISSQFNSPKTNPIGFLDSLLDTLLMMLQGGVDFIPSVMNQVIGIHEELASLRPFFSCHMALNCKMRKTANSKIKLVKFEVEKIIDEVMHINKKLTGEIESTDALPPQATTSKHEGASIGFKEARQDNISQKNL